MNIQLTTKNWGLLLREKNRTEDRDLVLGQQLKSDSDSNQRKVQWEVGKKQEEESEVIKED